MNIGQQIMYSEVLGGIEIVIKDKKIWWRIPVVLFFFIFDLLKGFFYFMRDLMAGTPDAVFKIGLSTYISIPLLGLFMCLVVLWPEFGEEVVSVNQDALCKSKRFRNFKVLSKKTFFVTNISSMWLDYLPLAGYTIYFKHLEKTEGFSFRFPEADARELIDLINKHTGINIRIK